jgi:hypothetical protein
VKNLTDIEILKDEVEMEIALNLSMLLAEAKRRGVMKFRLKSGYMFEIKYLNPDE